MDRIPGAGSLGANRAIRHRGHSDRDFIYSVHASEGAAVAQMGVRVYRIFLADFSLWAEHDRLFQSAGLAAGTVPIRGFTQRPPKCPMTRHFCSVLSGPA